MNRLKKLRESKGLTQLEFGKLFNASQNTVSNWENGNRRIDNDRLVSFAAYFDVSTDYLLGRSDVAEPAKNQPIADGDELDRELIDLMRDLSPEDFQRVKDFVAGFIARTSLSLVSIRPLFRWPTG